MVNEPNTRQVRHKLLFCTSQRLSLLRERTGTRLYLSGERFWRDRHAVRLGDEEPPSAWDEIARSSLVYRLTGHGDIKRLAVVCAAGRGKSINLQWMAKELAAPGSRQVPFLFALDQVEHDTPRRLLELMLPALLRAAWGNSDLSDERILPHLRRLRAQGRITLLFDSIDQATGIGLALVRTLLATQDWNACPMVLSARPHALFDGWEKLIVPNETNWQFVRVEPLAAEESERLLNQDGIDRWSRLPEGGKLLMANPRNIEYVRKCPVTERNQEGEPATVAEFTLNDLRTASHVFAGAVDHMVRYGMTLNPEARKLRSVYGPRDPLPDEPSERQIEFALEFLGALAIEMYLLPAPDLHEVNGSVIRPNVSHVFARQMSSFMTAVLKRLKTAGLVPSDYGEAHLDKDLQALAELNAEIKYDLLDTRPCRHGDFRWYDRSLQEFFAAWWLARHADAEDIKGLRERCYDDTRELTKASLYEPLWGFLAEMPTAARNDEAWTRATGVLLEQGSPRCYMMIYRAWPALLESPQGIAIIESWQEEYRKVLRDGGQRSVVARQIRQGFRRCPRDSADDLRSFLMGSPVSEGERYPDEWLHPVVVTPFGLQEFPVTNAQYELFDPGHAENRLGVRADKLHPAGEAVADHPVVNVTWYQAWCFARWTGHRLPTEAEWEFACRAGTTTAYNVGEKLDASQCNFAPNVGSTTVMGTYPPNAWLLYDMHGNVWEWCEDWYAEDIHQTNAAEHIVLLKQKLASARVLRGGCWDEIGQFCRSACRNGSEPEECYLSFGFRLATFPDVEVR